MTVFETIRNLISEGDLDQAIRLFITHLEKEKGDAGTLRTLRVLEARLNTVQQNERKNLIELSDAQIEYSKITDALLGVADDVEAGRNPAPLPGAEKTSGSKLPWLIGGGILILLGIIAGVLIKRSNRPPQKVVEAPVTQQAAQPKECPDFAATGFRVLLIPFQNLRGEASRPELGIQERIRTLTRKNNVDSDVEILPGKRFEDNTPDIRDAAEIGKKCAADMVVWGQYEAVGSNITVDVRYVFTQNPNLPAGEVSDTFKSLSELKSNRMKFNSLEEAVFSLCSMMALHEGKTELAEKWLDKVANPSPDMQKIRKMLKTGKR